MARYGKFRYGEQKYGPSPADALLRWSVIVAWDGGYTGENEALRATGITVRRGRQSMLTWSAEIKWDGSSFVDEAGKVASMQARRGRQSLLNSGGTGFAHYEPGEAVIVLDNEDGRYDPWNVASPLYPDVRPGKFVRIAVTYSGTTYEIMRGVIYDIQPMGNDKARLVVRDGLQLLKDTTLEEGLYQDERVSGVFPAGLSYEIMRDTSWNTTEWPLLLYNSVKSLDYWWSTVDNKSALTLLEELEDVEFGQFFHSRDGRAKFYARNQALTPTVITQDQILRDIVFPQPWEVIRNRVRVNAYTKVLDPVNAILWELQDITSIGAGETLTFTATFRYDQWQPCGASVIFNHTVNTKADGTGANITADVNLTYGEIGNGVTLTLENTGASDGYITLLKATGDAIYPPYVTTRILENTTSQADYGIRSFTLDNYWIESSEDARSYAYFVLTKLSDPLMYPTIQIEARPTVQFPLDLADLITLQVPAKGIDQTFRVGYIEHTWLRENGQAVRTKVKLEPYLDMATGFWALGTSELGVDTTLGF